jgi:nucleoside phosphorylase/Cdc6-like AAA superfamily ATPase
MSDPRQYTVGWICATTTAYTASRLFLDKVHDRSDHVSANDNNHYTIGEISGHRVVIAVMPDGEYGPGGATAIAEHMLDSFPDIRVCLTVGIGGGASIAQHDIRLGDIVVGVQHVKTGNVSQYDYGKTFQEGSFRQAGFHDQVPKTLRTAISKLRVRYAKRGHKLEANVTAILNAYPEMRQRYSRPTHESDRLYKPDFVHPTSSEVTCEQVCGKQNLVSRSEREEDEDNPAIHYGVIASADQPMKDATTRDTIAQENGVMCFETEAAGLMNSFPCLIVRGICDYSDSHKSAEWQGYAAMTAAAYTKDLLRSIVPSMIEQQQNIREITIEQQQNIRDVTVEHQGNIRNTDVEILRMQENSRRIAEWLSAPDTTTNHHRALQQHFDDTGLWFIHGDAFKKWKSQPGSFLWLHGSPGCGKTVLTSTIIEHLMQGTTHQVLLYFYFDFRDTNQQSLDSVLRSLATQLYRARPEASRSLYHLWASHEEGSRQPSTESLHNALQSMLNMVGSVSIILDALDESTTRHELLAWLRTLVKSKTTNCRLLVTSRRDGEIASALQSWTRAQDRILIQANEVNKDIRAYVKDRVCNGDELGRWHSRPDVLEEVELVLMEKADGM